MKLLQNTAIARVFKTLFLVSMLPLSAATQAETQNPKSNQYWWPDQLDLSSLRDHDTRSNPLGAD
ncbi:hypothetical protein N8756_10005, partial [Pseudomonadales bacterium]|nr:hypothetical protein [Pseudomonadales bacterium]